MDFVELRRHLEDRACVIDMYIEGAYWASNVLTQEACVIEDHNVYADATICHYCYELQVSPPKHLWDDFEKYKNFRDNEIPVMLPPDEE
jgi:hypothetical protein